jgi:flagellar L-ring protein FlgH
MNRTPRQQWFVGVLLVGVALSVVRQHAYARQAGAPEWSFAMGLYVDEKAHKVGDLLTVMIEEQSSASRSAQNQSSRSTSGGGSMQFSSPYYIKADGEKVGMPWQGAQLPAFDWQIGHNQSGGGQTTSEDGLSSTLTARVLDVLPNGNLLIEGRRMMHLEDERVEVILTGAVRPRDISADNVVSSSRMADATIRYQSAGPLRRDHRRGMFTRLWNWLGLF